jgi:uncharacterized protein YecT (DUF1311 family)
MKLSGVAGLFFVVATIMMGTESVRAQHMNAKDNPCDTSATTPDLYYCFSGALEKSDAELNQLYRRVQTVVEGDDLAKLKAAQRLWVQFRDANCDAEYELYDGGTAAPVVKLACLEAVTRHRTEELRVMYGWRLEKWGK